MLEKKNIGLNFLSAIFLQIITILLAFIVPKLMISTYSPQLHGFLSTISSLITYLMIVELGIASSSIQGLYKPLVSNDSHLINAGLNAIGRFYFRIGLLFTSLLFILAFIYPIVVTSNWSFQLVSLLIIFSGLSQLMEYFFGSKYRILLQADKKLYILNSINIFSVLIQGFLRIVLILNKVDILLVQLIPAVVYLFKLYLMISYIKKHYYFLDSNIPPDYTITSKKWNVFVHQITNLIVNNTDAIILSIVKGFSIVSVYSIYNLVISNLNGFFSQSFSTPMTANLGHLFVSDRDSFVKEYSFFEKLYYTLISLVLGISGIALLPFVKLYLGVTSGINYVDFGVMFLFVTNSLVTNLRVPLLTVVLAAGTFKETQNFAIFEAIINLILSLMLVNDFGIYGVLSATVCSNLYRFYSDITYVNYHILKRSKMTSVKLGVVSILGMSIPILIGYIFNQYIKVSHWIDLLYLCFFTGVISVVIYLVFIMVFDKAFFQRCLKFIFH
ncbi:TPA: lipopolysaccharide biosynthesis protein [Streptococcus suis]